MKTNLTFASVLTAGFLLLGGPALRAPETDDRIETSVKKSHLSKTCLGEDPVKTGSKDGMVVLTGTVSQASHRSFAQDTVSGVAMEVAEKSLVTRLAPDIVVALGVSGGTAIGITAASAR